MNVLSIFPIRNFRSHLLAVASILLLAGVGVHLAAQSKPVTRQETLRGSVTPEREWWDVLHYDLTVQFMPDTRMIRGSNVITFKAIKPGAKMQIDLQAPLAITKATYGSETLKVEREGNVYWLSFANEIRAGAEGRVEIAYEGRPTASTNPPWSGGVTWGRDDLGDHYITTTCQGRPCRRSPSCRTRPCRSGPPCGSP